MVIAKIYVDGVAAHVTELQKIPKGIAGAVIEVKYATNWDGLTKTAVFAGAVTRDVLNVGGSIVIPAEVVAQSEHRVKVGFYGVDGDKNLIIPTLWADLGIVQDAADPSGDPGADPELPVWAQLQKEFEELKESGGLNGFSPIAKVTQTESGAEISITDKDGTTTATVYNGIPGDDYVITPDDYAEIAEMAAGLVEVPEVPDVSMKPLTFTGAVDATYDGSEEVTVEIPKGGGGEWELLQEFDFDAETKAVEITENIADISEIVVVLENTGTEKFTFGWMTHVLNGKNISSLSGVQLPAGKKYFSHLYLAPICYAISAHSIGDSYTADSFKATYISNLLTTDEVNILEKYKFSAGYGSNAHGWIYCKRKGC